MFQSVKERRAERRAKLAWAIQRREFFKARANERLQKNCTANKSFDFLNAVQSYEVMEA